MLLILGAAMVLRTDMHQAMSAKHTNPAAVFVERSYTNAQQGLNDHLMVI
ncbi:hypothetical protein GPM19_12365 [Halomonas sp. ZH2S]|uniref:Uncharacterized protein n=1 Tax=Vreelandella zhuhanensis TaxID=2684210 RepID=A0A7X3KS46_9GAMM|nr:hypothetical protein [Halomonas zhuhanensis]MWJ28981.1 hypothetical protein [Halomonas zhuhanensis]